MKSKALTILIPLTASISITSCGDISTKKIDTAVDCGLKHDPNKILRRWVSINCTPSRFDHNNRDLWGVNVFEFDNEKLHISTDYYADSECVTYDYNFLRRSLKYNQLGCELLTNDVVGNKVEISAPFPEFDIIQTFTLYYTLLNGELCFSKDLYFDSSATTLHGGVTKNINYDNCLK